MYKLILFLSVIIVASCNTAKYNTKRAGVHIAKAMKEDPVLVAKFTRDNWPCTLLFPADTTKETKDSLIYIECPEFDNSNDYAGFKDSSWNHITPSEENRRIIDSIYKARGYIVSDKNFPGIKAPGGNYAGKTIKVPVNIPVSKFYINKYWEDSSKITIAYKEVSKRDQTIKELEKKIVVKNTIIKCMAAALLILLGLLFFIKKRK